MEKHFEVLKLNSRDLRSWTLSVLKLYGLKPRKKLSQSFVVDPRLINEVASYTEYKDTTEIGCGIGTLSLAIIGKVRSLVCIEIDERLCNVAKSIVKAPNFIVVCGDATRLELDGEQLVSNLPYHVTSSILVKLARQNNIKRAVLTVQREVGERLTSTPGAKSYGKITVLIKVLFDVKAGNIYPPSSFYPQPKVYHQVVLLIRKREYDEYVEVLEKVTKKLFTQRRRIVDKVFENLFKLRLEELGAIGKRVSGRRIYSLSPQDLLELAIAVRDRGLL